MVQDPRGIAERGSGRIRPLAFDKADSYQALRWSEVALLVQEKYRCSKGDRLPSPERAHRDVAISRPMN